MAPYTGPDGVPGALDYMSFSTALYGESDLWTLRQSSWLRTTSLPVLKMATSSDCPVTTHLSYYAPCFVRLWPYLFVISLCLLLPPASPLLPHTLSSLYLLSTQCSSSPSLQRGREKNVSVFYFLDVIVFLHKMNKINIFYYTEQKKVFFFTWLKVRDQNCNKENCYTCSCYFLFAAGVTYLLNMFFEGWCS